MGEVRDIGGGRADTPAEEIVARFRANIDEIRVELNMVEYLTTDELLILFAAWSLLGSAHVRRPALSDDEAEVWRAATGAIGRVMSGLSDEDVAAIQQREREQIEAERRRDGLRTVDGERAPRWEWD